MDTPKKYVKEITTLLLLVGCDKDILSSEGFTASQIATDSNNDEFNSAFEEFQALLESSKQNLDSNSDIELANSENKIDINNKYEPQPNTSNESNQIQTISEKRKILFSQYCLDSKMRTKVDRWKANFNVPEFIFEPQRAGYIPEGLKIYEHHIRPLIYTGFEFMHGTDSLHCLEFTREQALINQTRRENLVKLFDPDFKS